MQPDLDTLTVRATASDDVQADLLITIKGTSLVTGSAALGSVRQTLSDSGAVLGSVAYDSWGQVQSENAAATDCRYVHWRLVSLIEK